MKRLSLSFAMGFIFSGMTLAQFEAGSVFLGSTTNFGTGVYYSLVDGSSNTAGLSFITSHSESDDRSGEKYKSSSFNIAPKTGYFIIDGLVVGIDLPVWYSKRKLHDYKQSQTILMAGPFFRYYYGTGQIIPFVEAEASFGRVTNKSSGSWGTNKDKTGIKNFIWGIGAEFIVGQNISVDAMMGYKYYITRNKENNTNNSRVIVAAFGFAFGFTFVL